jgi:peptidoglycan/LPS O-acetylase OafA/YrhL
MARGERVPELDVLRFCAAASVVLFHFYVLLPGDTAGQRALVSVARFGFLGVPLFFMISGFVILWTAFNKSPRDFVLARFTRLYPTYWVCMLITSGVLILAGDVVPWKRIAANLTMVQHLFGFSSIDPVYWTLFIELKFYALVLALLVCRQLRHVERWLGCWLGLSVLSLIASHWRSGPVPGLDTVVFEGSAAYFASGCYAYLIRTQGGARQRWIGFGVSAVAGVFAALHIRFAYPDARDTDWQTVTEVVGIMVVAYGAIMAITLRVWRLPVSPIWYWLGSLTYPLYLLHAMAGTQLARMLPATWGVWSRIGVALAAVFAVTTLLAMTIEQRGCNALYRLLSRRGRAAPSAAVVAYADVGYSAPSTRNQSTSA